MTAKKQGLLKDGTRRATATKGGRGGGMPTIMWLAVVVCIVGAVFLFRSQNTDLPAGIGENQTVVTAPDVESHLAQDAGPRSGDVDITEQAPALTPEKSETESESGTDTPTVSVPEKTKPTVAEPAPTRIPDTPPPEPVMPLPNGPYVVQIGSYGNPANADKEAGRLQQLGWDARVKMGNTSTGAIIQRVHIGYFKSRTDAEAFIRQNRKQMSGAIAVHR